MKYYFKISAVVVILFLTACGKKGPIELPTSESYINPGLQPPENGVLTVTDTFTYFSEFNLYTLSEAWLGFSKSREIRAVVYTPVDDGLDTESTAYILKLKIKRLVNFSSEGFTAYPITENWDSNYISWEEFNDDEPWAVPGCDYDNTVSIHGVADAVEDEFIELDITDIIAYWSTHDNYGIVIVPDAGISSTDMSFVSFYTPNSDSSDDHPVIEYFDGTDTQTITINTFLHIADTTGSITPLIDNSVFALGDSITPVISVDFSPLDYKWNILDAVLSFEADTFFLDSLFDVDVTDIDNTDTSFTIYSIEDSSQDNFDYDNYSVKTPGYDAVSGRLTLDITSILEHAWENGYDIAIVPKMNRYMLRYIDLENPQIDIVYRKNIEEYEEEEE